MNEHVDPAATGNILALLAIERSEPGVPLRCVCDRGQSQRIGQALAADLVRIDPETDFAQFDLLVAGAVFDQVQILRPGWPVHASLLRAQARVTAHASDAAIVAIGAHDERMPDTDLEPDRALFGSPLLLMPFALTGDAALASATSARFERNLLDRGQASAALALAVQETFAIHVAHAQVISVFDLCAIACAQYQHAGMSELWRVIETALLRPDDESECEPGPGAHVRYRNRAVTLEGDNQRLLDGCRALFTAHAIAKAPRAVT